LRWCLPILGINGHPSVLFSVLPDITYKRRVISYKATSGPRHGIRAPYEWRVIHSERHHASHEQLGDSPKTAFPTGNKSRRLLLSAIAKSNQGNPTDLVFTASCAVRATRPMTRLN